MKKDNNKHLTVISPETPVLASHLVPIEKQVLSAQLDGSQGLFRVDSTLPRMIKANNDLEAIQEWLDYSTERSTATWRSYRKEAERLLAWAIIEHNKPLSSLDMADMNGYKKFLKDRVSRHDGVEWIAAEVWSEKKQAYGRKRYNRTDQDWRPFDGPLSPSSIDYALRVLKSLFTFWSQTGYTQLNPLALKQKKTSVLADKAKKVSDRSLDIDTWRYLYQFIEMQVDAMPPTLNEKERLRWLRIWHRAEVIFATLYLLGLRISELATLKMSDFHQRDGKNAEGQFIKYWWVTVIGKGNKERDIPLPHELMAVISRYRQFLNTFPHASRVNSQHDDNRGSLPELPQSNDETPLILSSTGLKGVSANRLYVIIKDVMAEAVSEFEAYQAVCRNQDIEPLQVDLAKLQSASSHWMRHTSATHQGLEGISLRHRQKSLGHASIDTTTIYDHGDNDVWAADVEGFSTHKNGGSPLVAPIKKMAITGDVIRQPEPVEPQIVESTMKNLAGHPVSIFLFRFDITHNGISFVVNEAIAEDMYDDIDQKIKPLAHACCLTLSRYKDRSIGNTIMDGNILTDDCFEVMLSTGLGKYFIEVEKQKLFDDAHAIANLLLDVMDRRTKERDGIP